MLPNRTSLVWVTYRVYEGGPAIRCTAEPLSLSTLVAKAKVQEDIRTLLSRAAKRPPVPGHGYGPVPKAKTLPAGGAYLPASSWEPMLPDTGINDIPIAGKATASNIPSEA